MRVIVVLLFALGVSNLSGQSSNPYARDLVEIVKYFEGEFDNDAQLWYEGRRDWDGQEADKHKRLHATHTKISLPDLGEHVFYVEEYLNDDPEEIIRQRIASFSSSRDMGGVQMKLFFLNDPKKYVNAQDSLVLFEDFGVDGLTEIPTCHILFKREGDQYFGQMPGKQCQFEEGDKSRYSVHDIHLSATKYWRVDQTYLVSNDELYSGHLNSEPYKMRKVHHYNCDVSFTEKGYYDPSGNDKKYEGIAIHDQGGKATLHNPIKDKRYVLQLRNKQYPFYTEGSDFFMLRFIEEGAARSEVIVTSEPGVSKISFSLGWSSASCYLIE